MSTSKSSLQHYHLVAGMVIFTRPESEEIEQLHLNTTIVSDVRNVTAKDIGKAQQALQMLLFQRLGVELNVIDVFIIGVSYLGHMTQAKFIEGVEQLQNAA